MTQQNPPPAHQTAKQGSQPTTDWWMVIPTWLLAASTIGLSVYTAMLWKATGQLYTAT